MEWASHTQIHRLQLPHTTRINKTFPFGLSESNERRRENEFSVSMLKG